MKYFEALKKSSKLIDAYFEQSKDILHSASKGTIREAIIEKILLPYTPGRYGLSSGEAFDIEGNVSKQLDLVIYDKLHSYIIPYMDKYIQFPCESVYGNIEIKSMLNNEELEKAIENIASLKKLNRENSRAWDVNPMTRISINGLPKDGKFNYYIGVIFAYDSIGEEKIIKSLNETTIDKKLLPSIIVLYNKKTIILPKSEKHIEAQPFFDNPVGFKAIYCGDDTIAVFLGLLLSYLHVTKLMALDLSKIVTKQLEEKLQEDVQKQIVNLLNDNKKQD